MRFADLRIYVIRQIKLPPKSFKKII